MIKINSTNGLLSVALSKQTAIDAVGEMLWNINGSTKLSELYRNGAKGFVSLGHELVVRLLRVLGNSEDKLPTQSQYEASLAAYVKGEKLYPEQLMILQQTDNIGSYYGKNIRAWSSYSYVTDVGTKDNKTELWEPADNIDQLQNLINSLPALKEGNGVTIHTVNIAEVKSCVIAMIVDCIHHYVKDDKLSIYVSLKATSEEYLETLKVQYAFYASVLTAILGTKGWEVSFITETVVKAEKTKPQDTCVLKFVDLPTKLDEYSSCKTEDLVTVK
jgi:thymidylate synthase